MIGVLYFCLVRVRLGFLVVVGGVGGGGWGGGGGGVAMVCRLLEHRVC